MKKQFVLLIDLPLTGLVCFFFFFDFVIVGCTDIPFPPGVAPSADEIDESSTRLQSLLSRDR
jgi:hypothetical protein